MQKRRATIITLNYDTLVESAFLELSTADHFQLNSWDFRPFGVLPDATYFGGPADPGIRLLKLHGSVHWTYSGVEHYFGESIRDGAVNRWSVANDNHRPFALDDGRVPLIVPPTFNKNRYFENEKVRHLWRRAWLALSGADRVFCIGYSLPEGDLLMRALLNDAAKVKLETCGTTNHVPLYVIDRARETAERYRSALHELFDVKDTYIEDGDDVTEHFVRTLLSGELNVEDGVRITADEQAVHDQLRKRYAHNPEVHNVRTAEPFKVGRCDQYGMIVPYQASRGTRYVIWEVFVALLMRIDAGEFYAFLTPGFDYPRQVPLNDSKDIIDLSLLLEAGLIEHKLQDTRIQFSRVRRSFD